MITLSSIPAPAAVDSLFSDIKKISIVVSAVIFPGYKRIKGLRKSTKYPSTPSATTTTDASGLSGKRSITEPPLLCASLGECSGRSKASARRIIRLTNLRFHAARSTWFCSECHFKAGKEARAATEPGFPPSKRRISGEYSNLSKS